MPVDAAFRQIVPEASMPRLIRTAPDMVKPFNVMEKNLKKQKKYHNRSDQNPYTRRGYCYLTQTALKPRFGSNWGDRKSSSSVKCRIWTTVEIMIRTRSACQKEYDAPRLEPSCQRPYEVSHRKHFKMCVDGSRAVLEYPNQAIARWAVSAVEKYGCKLAVLEDRQ